MQCFIYSVRIKSPMDYQIYTNAGSISPVVNEIFNKRFAINDIKTDITF